MGDRYEVCYWDYHKGEYVSVGYYHWFFQAKRAAKKLCKEWPCVSIVMRIKD